MGYRPWGCKESDMTEQLTHTYDPPISLLGIYPDKTIIQKDICTPVFIAALFPIARTRKQPKCPSIVDWIQKM